MIEGILKKYGHLGVGPPAGWSSPPATAASPTAPMGFGQVHTPHTPHVCLSACACVSLCGWLLYARSAEVWISARRFTGSKQSGLFFFRLCVSEGRRR